MPIVKLKPDDFPEVARRYQAGESLEEIARAFDVQCRGNVSRFLSRNGIARRGTGRQKLEPEERRMRARKSRMKWYKRHAAKTTPTIGRPPPLWLSKPLRQSKSDGAEKLSRLLRQMEKRYAGR